MLLVITSFLTAFLHLCSATSLIIAIPPSAQLPNPNTLSSSTHGTLLSGLTQDPPLRASLTTRSTIEFHNLTIRDLSLGPRSYLLTISAPSHIFASYRVDVIPSGSSDSSAVIEGVWETYPGTAWSEKGAILGGKAAQGGGASGSVNSTPSKRTTSEQVVRVEAKVLTGRDFYEKRPGFNPLGLLMNPMLLLGVAAMGITFGMPYLMDNSMSFKSFLCQSFFPPTLMNSHSYIRIEANALPRITSRSGTQSRIRRAKEKQPAVRHAQCSTGSSWW